MAHKTICSNCGRLHNFNEKCNCRKEESKRAYKLRKLQSNGVVEGADRFSSTYKWKKKRLTILKRDNYLCQRCKIKYGILNGEELTVHHIKSRKNHPELAFEDSNLITLCKTCNNQLGTKDKLDFDWEMEEREFILG